MSFSQREKTLFLSKKEEAAYRKVGMCHCEEPLRFCSATLGHNLRTDTGVWVAQARVGVPSLSGRRPG